MCTRQYRISKREDAMPRGKGIYDDEERDAPDSGRAESTEDEREEAPDVADTRGEPTA
jgi:hypothetical protein